MNLITLTFVLYLALLLGIGAWAYSHTRDLSGYILGGRKLGAWPSALSACASDMSGWLLLGLPGYAMATGVEVFWLAGGLLLGTWLNWRVVARRLRVYSLAADNALTLPAYFEKRFADNSRSLRVISAAFVLLFFLFYTSSGLVAGGKLFSTVFGFEYAHAVLFGAAAVISYTLFGGFLAVSWTDVVQGLLMAAALLIVPLMAMNSIGGYPATIAAMQAENPALLNLFSDSRGHPMTLIAVLSLLGWGLGYFGQPHILARFKAISSPHLVPTARHIAVTWTGLTMLGACFVGFAGIGYLDTPLSDEERVFMVLVDALFHPVIAGVLLAAILSAIMSTADSQLLVASSALAEDFYKALLRSEASEKELVRVSRLAVIGIAVIATLLALNEDSKVLELVAYAWAGFGAAFGPALVLSLYWQRMNRWGALAGIITGGTTVVIWKQLSGGLFELYEIIPGCLLATIACVTVSLLSEKPSEAIQLTFAKVEKELNQ